MAQAVNARSSAPTQIAFITPARAIKNEQRVNSTQVSGLTVHRRRCTTPHEIHGRELTDRLPECAGISYALVIDFEISDSHSASFRNPRTSAYSSRAHELYLNTYRGERTKRFPLHRKGHIRADIFWLLDTLQSDTSARIIALRDRHVVSLAHLIVTRERRPTKKSSAQSCLAVNPRFHGH